MSIVSKEDADKMTDKQKKEYHEWCWFVDYGNCDKCAIKAKELYKSKQGK